MKNTASRRILKSIFELRAGDRTLSSEEYAVSKLPLPTLDERIDLYSRAVYGPELHNDIGGTRSPARSNS